MTVSWETEKKKKNTEGTADAIRGCFKLRAAEDTHTHTHIGR